MPQTPFPWFSGIIGRRLLDQSWGRILFRRHPVHMYILTVASTTAIVHNSTYILQGTYNMYEFSLVYNDKSRLYI